jgi:hypothetical protein
MNHFSINITKPTYRATWEGEIANYWFDESGALVSLSQNIKRTIKNISSKLFV